MSEFQALDQRIRTLLAAHGRLSQDAMQLAPEDDLYQAGLTSHASVNVMLALEGEFDVEFPDSMLNRTVFSSVAAMRSALLQLGVSAQG
jgi:acyl carrier protein